MERKRISHKTTVVFYVVCWAEHMQKAFDYGMNKLPTLGQVNEV